MSVSLSALEFKVAEAVNHVSGAAVSVFKYCTAWDAWKQYAAAKRAVNEALPVPTPSSSGVGTFFDKKTGKRLPPLQYKRDEYELAEDLASTGRLALELPFLSAMGRYLAVLSIPTGAVIGSLMYAGLFPEQTGSGVGWLMGAPLEGAVLGGAFGVMFAGKLAITSMKSASESVQMLNLHNEYRAEKSALT